MIHALAYAVVENLRSAADVIKVVADEAQRRNEKSLDIPRRALDKFYEVYQEPVHEQA